jgi:hypothetical protein
MSPRHLPPFWLRRQSRVNWLAREACNTAIRSLACVAHCVAVARHVYDLHTLCCLLCLVTTRVSLLCAGPTGFEFTSGLQPLPRR